MEKGRIHRAVSQEGTGNMLQSKYDFVIEVTTAVGQMIHEGEILNTLTSCYDELLLRGVCEGHFPNDGTQPVASLDPVWAESGPPSITGFSISLPPFSPQTYDLSLVQDHLRHILSEQQTVERSNDQQSDLAAEQSVKIQWTVQAYERKKSAVKPGRLSLKLVRQPLPFSNRSLKSFGISAISAEQQPLAIMIRQPLLTQLCEEAANSLERERANILTGHLVKDPAMEKPVVIILTKITAETDTAASRNHFAFSPLTFQSIQHELSVRANGEIIVGWWHNHPPPCGGECRLVIPPCKTSTVFFSSADRAVQRSSFPDPYMVAFVSGKGESKGAHDPETRSFGARAGAGRATSPG